MGKGEHLIDGEFQSDKYPTCPAGKVPLSTKDPMAQDLLWEYAQRRRKVDEAFSSDLEEALRLKGFDPKRVPNFAELANFMEEEAKGYDLIGGAFIPHPVSKRERRAEVAAILRALSMATNANGPCARCGCPSASAVNELVREYVVVERKMCAEIAQEIANKAEMDRKDNPNAEDVIRHHLMTRENTACEIADSIRARRAMP